MATTPPRDFAPEIKEAVRRLLVGAVIVPARSARGAAPGLVLVDRRGKRHLIGSARMVIGRTHVSGPSVDIEVDDAEVSRHHAAVTLLAGGPAVVDCGSTNGTRILRQGASIDVGEAPVRLMAGDRLVAADDILLGDVT